jgi:hypothetical protein
MQQLYQQANLSPPVPPRTLSLSEAVLRPTNPPLTPGLSTQNTRQNILSASGLSIANLHMALINDQDKLGIKVKAGNMVGNRFTPTQNEAPGTFKAAEIALGTKSTSPTCIAKEINGGIDYTLGTNVSPINRAAAIEKICQLAVNNAGVNTVFAFPANADEKATFEALNKALKQKYGEGYPTNPKLPPFWKKEEIPIIKGYDELVRKYPSAPEATVRRRDRPD